jgi:transposase
MRLESETTRRSWELPDALWPRMEAGLPPPRGKAGHPRPVHLRRITAGIVYVLRTGIPWPACRRERVGPPRPVDDEWAQGVQAGVFAHVWAAVWAVDDDLQGRDWTWQRVDGALPNAPGGGGHRPPSHGPGPGWDATPSGDRRPGPSPGDSRGRRPSP